MTTLSVRAGTVGKNFFVRVAFDATKWKLVSDDGQIEVLIPKLAWQFLAEADSVTLFLNVVRSGLEEDKPPGIELPGLIGIGKGH